MATIQENIDRIKQAKDELRAKLIEKGVSIPENATIEQYAALAETIKSEEWPKKVRFYAYHNGEGSGTKKVLWDISTTDGSDAKTRYYTMPVYDTNIKAIKVVCATGTYSSFVVEGGENLTSGKYMFAGEYQYGSNFTNIDVSKLYTSNMTNMSHMFYSCSGVTSLDVTNFDTSKVTRMDCMFSGCKNLTTLDVSKFNTSNVTDAREMFSDCNKLKAIDISNFDLSKNTDFSDMFYNCKSLEYLDLSGLDTTNHNCNNLEYHHFFDSSQNASGWNIKDIKVSEKTFRAKIINKYTFYVDSWTDTDSLQRFVDALPTNTSTKTLGFHANTKNALTDAQKEIIASKKWAIA